MAERAEYPAREVVSIAGDQEAVKVNNILKEIRLLLKIMAVLILFLNILLAVHLLVNTPGTAEAEIEKIIRVDIAKVSGKWLSYGTGLPVYNEWK